MMASGPGDAGDRDRQRLLRVIRKVRNRWRLRTLLRGASFVAAGGIGALLVTA